MYPQASRDGSKICFVVDAEVEGKKVRSVHYMQADGSGRRLVARGARQPCWSPDGRTIAYLKSEFPVFNVQDFATKQLVFYDLSRDRHRPHPNPKLHHLYNICWAPNGRWIVATVHGGMGFGHAILAIATEGDAVVNLKIGGCRPDLSPDGKRIVWGKDDHTIGIADIDLESSRPKITNIRNLVRDEKHLYHSDWSPDGKYVAFSRGPGGRQPARGPGTNRGIAEIVSVRAEWDLCVIPALEKSPWLQLTSDGKSNKEPDWIFQKALAGVKP
jgi:Tol biopolymer transport system component